MRGFGRALWRYEVGFVSVACLRLCHRCATRVFPPGAFSTPKINSKWNGRPTGVAKSQYRSTCLACELFDSLRCGALVRNPTSPTTSDVRIPEADSTRGSLAKLECDAPHPAFQFVTQLRPGCCLHVACGRPKSRGWEWRARIARLVSVRATPPSEEEPLLPPPHFSDDSPQAHVDLPVSLLDLDPASQPGDAGL